MRLGAVIFAIMAIVSSGPAHAQHFDDSTANEPSDTEAQTQPATQPQTSQAALRRVAESCQAETQHFCPTLQPSPTPRDEAICLKYYKTSLSLGCRGAINAVTR
jgi:Tfp pilus assembly protein PilE